MDVCDSVESSLNIEDEEMPDQGSAEMLLTSFGDQARPSVSQPRVVGSVFTQPRETLTTTFDDRGTWDVCVNMKYSRSLK